MDTSTTAIGYHGTSTGAVRGILRSGFLVDERRFHWLGRGVYFWQDAPQRARLWAESRFGAEAAVLKATISLQHCIDLLDVKWVAGLSNAYDELVTRSGAIGQALPEQGTGAHWLDFEVLEFFVGMLTDMGFRVCSVRCAFTEGAPVYPGSAIASLAHVQIAVRDLAVISDLGTNL